MGEQDISDATDPRAIRDFTVAILRDLRALELAIDQGMIEENVRRIGVEQEMFLVDANGRPAPIADQVLPKVQDGKFTSELAQFNLEANLPPIALDGGFLSRLEEDLDTAVATIRNHAQALGGDVLLTGILPSLRREDLTRENMSPQLRYEIMDDAFKLARHGAYEVHIDGIDRLETVHDCVMIESANTSLQLHLQVDAQEFPSIYNLAQLITAPLLSAATNSPLLLGKRLWHETRIALFEGTLDERTNAQVERRMPSRVSFGDRWIEQSALELFRDTVARHQIIMTRRLDEDPLELVNQGLAPKLQALSLHNGTVWRWNRPCYGVLDGRATLRIENRVLPAGPTIRDEVANAALFYGMIFGLKDDLAAFHKTFVFEHAKQNFFAAAKLGLDATFTWLDSQRIHARRLLLEHLIPAAHSGLLGIGVPADDIEHYLGCIQSRVETGLTGSTWLLNAVDAADPQHSEQPLLESLSREMLANQSLRKPVHQWSEARSTQSRSLSLTDVSVGDIMTRDVFTVSPDDVLDLATAMMEWKHFRHVPVENHDGQVVGLLNHKALLKLSSQQDSQAVPIVRVMDNHPTTVSEGTSFAAAVDIMLDTDTDCLLVTSGEILIGIVTERDLLRMCKLHLQQ